MILFSNSAHFAASTVRLYTKPGATRQLPFLSFVFPFIAFAGAALGVIFPSTVAAHFYSLYLSWSPYHYAAQAYGLALMYAYRAGVQLTQGQRRFFFVSCLMGFFLAMLSQNDNRAGIWWVVPWVWTRDYPVFGMAVKIIRGVLIGLSLIAPMASFFWIRRSNAKPLPLISLLIPVTNGLWFGIFPFMGAFGLSAVFHGLQYLAIVTIFHVRDQQEREDNRHGWAYHAVWFYLACLLLGYALFQCWPYGFYALLGLDHAMSVFVIVAAINIHHFIVDAYIWKLRKDPNYRIVLQGI
ncbi:hypothetical protein HY256_02395 [Candidatus Sumerlaeota bacterium]|nr:hypothetical protein [Candidatus Sumerlaeota bacterium]